MKKPALDRPETLALLGLLTLLACAVGLALGVALTQALGWM